MEVYVDGKIINSKATETHLSDMAETFQTLKKIRHAIEPVQVHLRGRLRQIPWLHHLPERGGCKPREDLGDNRDATPNPLGGGKNDKEYSGTAHTTIVGGHLRVDLVHVHGTISRVT